MSEQTALSRKMAQIRKLYTLAYAWRSVDYPEDGHTDLSQLRADQEAEFDAALAEHDAAAVTAAPKPRTVATETEIAALPRLTVVRSGDRFWQKLGGVMPYHEWQSPDGGFAVNNAHFADYLEFRDPAEIVSIPLDTP